MKTSNLVSRFLLSAAFLATTSTAFAQIAPPPVPPPPRLELDTTPEPSGAAPSLAATENRPPLDWYRGPMSDALAGLESAANKLQSWAEKEYGGDPSKVEHYNLAYFSDWLHGYMQGFRAETYYTESGSRWVWQRHQGAYGWEWRRVQLQYDEKTPRWFNGHGYYATRGDHNNFHYNYARTVYYWTLTAASTLKERYGYDARSPYNQLVGDLIESYQRYTQVNYGRVDGSSAPIDLDPQVARAEREARGAQAKLAVPTRSSSIALTSDNARLVVVNRQKGSVSIIQVRNEYGYDDYTRLAEVPVGREPRYVALSPDDKRAFVSNAVDGTLSVVDLTAARPYVEREIAVGTEPRGVAVTPNGKYVYVANHTEGTVSVVRTRDYSLVNTVAVGGNPMAVSITNNGDEYDADENVLVTRFFSEVIDPERRPDGFNDSKQGVVHQFNVEESLRGAPSLAEYVLSPIADTGFTADRRQFCQKTRNILQENGEVVFFNSGVNGDGDGASDLANETFCPDPYSYDASPQGPIARDPQGAYPNQLFSALIRNGRLIVPNVGASPEPPVQFATNIQALVSNIDLSNGQEVVTNLNDQIKTEAPPAPGELNRLFGSEVVAVDADAYGEDFLFVSRGGNYVMRAQLDKAGNFDINAPEVTRFKTGNIPSGVVMSSDGRRAYTNNEVSTSVTAIDLEKNEVLEQDISSSSPPAPGTAAHKNLVGKLAFFSSLGIPDDLSAYPGGPFDIEIRDIDPLEFRNKASASGWSSCASCHEDGHSDNVTWVFPTGPRQSIALEGTFANGNIHDQRILNWNGVRGSITDFNNNSRGVQGGTGHATNVRGVDRTAEVFNHGPTEGISDALDALTQWVAKAVRAPIQPAPRSAFDARLGRQIFELACADCHGGEKWTKSTIAGYETNPTFAANPLGANFFADGREPPLDPRLTVAGPQIVSLFDNWVEVRFLDEVGTLDPRSAIELRGAGALGGGVISIPWDPNEGREVARQSTQGFASLGGLGFNSPSLLGVAYHAPYLHDGSAETLREVFRRHTLPEFENRSIEWVLGRESYVRGLEQFLLSIDDQTEPVFVESAPRPAPAPAPSPAPAPAPYGL